MIDADCEASDNLLGAFAAGIGTGADALQASYVISNPESGPGAALRWAGFGLFNFIRPSGRTQLGLSCGLLGTGMAFTRGLLLRSPWRAVSFAEDREQHMRWVLNGVRVAFVPDAGVSTRAPTSPSARSTQEARWESGRGALLTSLTPKLLAKAVRDLDVAALDAAIEPQLPPQSALVALTTLGLVASRISGCRGVMRLADTAALAQCTYVFLGLALVRAPAVVWRALAFAPVFVARRLVTIAKSMVGAGPAGWERTPRELTHYYSSETGASA